MLDAEELKDFIADKWNITPTIGTDPVDDLFLAIDEFNPNNPKYQIVFINRSVRNIFVSPNVGKIEQDVVLEVHVKLIRYDPDTVEATRTVFKNIKGELDRIFTTYRYDNVGSTLNMSGWIDSKLPHGFGEEKEPLELVSRLTVEISEYKAIGNSRIGTRVARINILGSDLLGLIDAVWQDTDPWVLLQIPKGPIIEQHLLGPHVHGEFTTHDWKSLYTLLYTIAISTGKYPIMSDNSKMEFSTVSPYDKFIIEMKDHNGIVSTFNFRNVKIKQIELLKCSTSGLLETVFRVTWMSDYVYPVTPT